MVKLHNSVKGVKPLAHSEKASISKSPVTLDKNFTDNKVDDLVIPTLQNNLKAPLKDIKLETNQNDTPQKAIKKDVIPEVVAIVEKKIIPEERVTEIKILKEMKAEPKEIQNVAEIKIPEMKAEPEELVCKAQSPEIKEITPIAAEIKQPGREFHPVKSHSVNLKNTHPVKSMDIIQVYLYNIGTNNYKCFSSTITFNDSTSI